MRIRIRVGSKAVEEVALLNSGFEAPTPQLLIPISTARTLVSSHPLRMQGG